MAYITELWGWYDPGWTEGSPVRLRRGASPSTSDADLHLTTDYHPSTDRLFSEIRLSESNYYLLRNVGYIRVSMDMNNGNDFIVYGYVDSVDIISDTSTLSNVSVKWHPDHWETFKASASLEYAHLLRRASGDHPLQGYSSVRRYVTSGQSLLPSLKTAYQNEVWWVVIAHTVTQSGHTQMLYKTYPVSDDYTDTLYGSTGTPPPLPFLDLSSTAAGKWDEILGIAPSTVTGIWISPVPPFGAANLLGDGSAGNPYDTVDPSNTWYLSDNGTLCWFVMATVADYGETLPEVNYTVTETTSTERHPVIACGFDGEPLAEFPVGVTLKNLTYRTILSATECKVSVRFDGLASRADGLNVTIPCLPLDLTENAWSEYYYSGQRALDIDSRTIASQQAMMEKTIGGASQGFIMGGFNPAGAGLSALAGAVGGVTQGVLDVALFNPMQQSAIDKQRSKQTAGILLAGGAVDAIMHGEKPQIKRYSFDAVSEAMASASDSYHGYAVDLYVASLGSLIGSTTTGFWQAEGVNVGGDIPAEAKRYISDLLKRGVYLI